MPRPVPWVHAFVDVPAEQADVARSFWSAVTGWPAGAPWDAHREFSSFEPPDGTGHLHVQVIGGRARVHLDLLGDPDRDAAALEVLGATRGHRGDAWQVMTSPGGLPFCVCGEPGPHTPPPSATWPDGHRSRLVQVSVDVPAERFEAELAFWRRATGWADEPLRRPEFRRLVHRAESPVQLLVQRLGPDDGATKARAHLDLGTDDLPVEVARVRALGAEVLGEQDGFTALRDPVGLPFCVTTNDPGR